MKKLLLFLLVLPCATLAQNYFAKADSCIKIKDYVCAAANYDLALKADSESNGIAFMSAKAWGMAGEKEKTLSAIRVYVRNNILNNYPFFSAKMLKERSFDFLHSDPQWAKIVADVQKNENAVRAKEKKKVDSVVAIQVALEKHQMSDHIDINKTANVKAIYRQIKNYNAFPMIASHYLSLQFKINDSLKMAFLVVMPKNYTPKRSYSVLFFLHGAVSMNSGYLQYADDRDTKDWNRFYTKYAGDVIMVYPHGNRDYNWMYPDKGFYMVSAILKQIKQIMNVEDNRVFISGHSNGATGSFSYLMKQPSPFAAFYGFNTRPRVQTGGTYIRNILNRSYYNISTDNDYYYPPDANDSLSVTMKKIGADYQDHRYNGFPHWFPQFDESEPAHRLLFNDLAKRKRNPFHHDIYWECDDLKYGRCDWLQINSFDTTAKSASWQQPINFPIKKWKILGPKNQLITKDTVVSAFKYAKRSGAVKASYRHNVFTIETSDVKSFSILLSPEMIDFKRPVTIIVNGTLYGKVMPRYDKDFLIEDFRNNIDRVAVWAGTINVTLH